MSQRPHTRPYTLSSVGRASLQASTRRNRPWLQSTGPRTAQGKARSSRNALKHGQRSAGARTVDFSLHRTLELVGGNAEGATAKPVDADALTSLLSAEVAALERLLL